MKIYAKDLIDFLNRDWGLASMACVDLQYLEKFSTLESGKFTAPKNPDAVVDLDELNCAVANVTVADTTSPETPPMGIPIVTLVRLLQMIGVKDASDTTLDPPSLRNHPELALGDGATNQ